MDKVVGLLIRIRIHMGPAIFQSTGHPASGGEGPSLERTVPHPVVQFRSVPSLFATLCDSRDFSTPGFLAHHQLRELAQTHVHSVSDVIQPSHPLSSPSLPAFTLSQQQGLFQRVFFASGGQSILKARISGLFLDRAGSYNQVGP